MHRLHGGCIVLCIDYSCTQLQTWFCPIFFFSPSWVKISCESLDHLSLQNERICYTNHESWLIACCVRCNTCENMKPLFFVGGILKLDCMPGKYDYEISFNYLLLHSFFSVGFLSAKKQDFCPLVFSAS